MTPAVPPEDWKWYGTPGHYILADDCIFHMTTQVGKWLVSTVGDLHRRKGPPVRETKGLQNCEAVAIGRFFETMIFLGEDGQQVGIQEGDAIGYDMGEEATAGHYKACREWAAKQDQAPTEREY